MRVAEVTCPDCLQLPAVRSLQAAEPVVHDTHAVPAGDEPAPVTETEINPGDLFADRDDDEWVAVSTGPETFLVNPVFLFTVKHALQNWAPLIKYDLGEGEPITPTGKELADWERDLIASSRRAKSHDLSIVRVHGNVVIEANDQNGSHLVYLQDGVALDLGRVLAVLTPTQREVLIDDLTDGAK